MKAFDEWWLMEGQNIVGNYDQQERDLASNVWQAALEWVESGCGKTMIGKDRNIIADELEILEDEKDYIADLILQADSYGMESLTEDEQAILESRYKDETRN